MRFILCVLFISIFHVNAQSLYKNKEKEILPGAYQTEKYFPLLLNKRVAVFANHTSVIEQTHLVDSLIHSNINVVKIFAPEHGFRGKTSAGEKINNSIDSSTQIPIISLYGSKLKPSNADLTDVDVMLFDIQDVGVRFYTFISSLEYFIEAAIENDRPLIILDRPNPNGFYVDGPVLQKEYKSFVGMQPIPIVYGMTIGEYAKMLIGEQWLKWKYIRDIDNRTSLGELLGFENEKIFFSLEVISCKNYTHQNKYILPIAPSPNLPTMQSVYCYPSTCLFEGTVISEGRGTEHPFCIFGHPKLPKNLFLFKPQSNVGATNPKFSNEICYGWNLFNVDNDELLKSLNHSIQIKYLVQAYQMFGNKSSFFVKPKSEKDTDYFFNKLVGSNILMKQLKENKSEKEIRLSWKKDIETFKKIRKKYLLYKDFE